MAENLQYNERAWAIDVISEINSYVLGIDRAVKKAGGEISLKSLGSNTLFPDVILFGDDSKGLVRHGWELKFPDTSINDRHLFENAVEKAKRLNVNSFILWNVNEAVLYVANDENIFISKREWHIQTKCIRQTVKENYQEWSTLLITIIDDLNDYFDRGDLSYVAYENIFDNNFFANIINQYSSIASDNINKACNENALLEAELKEWKLLNTDDYKRNSNIIGSLAISDWVNKLFFCHYLKRFQNKASDVEIITCNTSITEADNIFAEITNKCNFAQIFKNNLVSKYIGTECWRAVCEVNEFLCTIELQNISQEIFHAIIEKTIINTARKVAGQYATPENLAKFLVALTLEDRSANVFDPCCGSGTIIKSAYALKVSKGFNPKDALKSVWASDRFPFPLQLTTVALSNNATIGEVVQVFKEDVFSLKKDDNIEFTDPNNANIVVKKLSNIHAIVSNLPFIRFENLRVVNPNVPNSRELDINGKSDISAYIIIHLYNILEDNGNIGLIISNSWLATEWGVVFRKKLENLFYIKAVITSEAGKWFDNADIVTNIIIMSKRKALPNESTKFITTKKPISEWENNIFDDMQKNYFIAKDSFENDNLSINIYAQEEINELSNYSIGWSPFFAKINWLNDIKNTLIPVNHFFDIARGERRGCNELFYPTLDSNIEQEFLKPVLKTMKTVSDYIAYTDGHAFCCNVTESYLEKNGFHGALNWIKRFENKVNSSGKLLTNVLKQSNLYWYQMDNKAQADIVLGMNPDKRISFGLMNERGFVDQRLIRFTAKEDIDIKLCHALLNSILGIYMIEASGFGRGLGALDLSANKLKQKLHMLNPINLTEDNIVKIKKAFEPLLRREVLDLLDELNSEDRHYFDIVVLSAFKIEKYYNDIKASLLKLYSIRKSID